MTIFSCTKNKVKLERKWKNTISSLSFNGEKTFTRNRMDLDLARHFVEFLLSSNLIHDIAYGTSFINFPDVSKQLLPKPILKLSKSHTINEYNKY